MKLYRVLITVFFLFSATGCVYYNMFFNGKEYYNEAEEKRKKNKVVDKSLYKKSIKELSKILEFYPDSKWVDDALLMMGKCYYQRNEYQNARRKYLEMISNFKESELIPEAKMQLARAEIALQNFDEAKILIEEIEKAELDIAPYDQNRLFAEFSIVLEDSSAAMEFYIKAASFADGDLLKEEELVRAGELAEKLGEYEKGISIYKELFGFSEKREKIVTYKLKYSEMLEKSGHPNQAKDIIESIIDDKKYIDFFLQAHVQYAKLNYLLKEYQPAKEMFDNILYENEKDKDNKKSALLAETGYYLGEYFLNVERDLYKAEVMYDSSLYYFARSDYADLCKKKTKKIIEHNSIKQFFVDYDSLQLNLSNMIDTINFSLDTLVVAPDSIKYYDKHDSIKIFTDESFNMQEDYIKKSFKLAEIYWYDFNFPDSCENYLNRLVGETKYPHIASRAMYMLAVINRDIRKKADKYNNLADSLLLLYPLTATANAVREERGLEKVEIVEDSAKFLFSIYSQDFLDSNYSKAYKGYRLIADRYHDSEIAPKVLQAAALLQENYLDNLELAAQLYGELKEKYRGTPEAFFAGKKLLAEGSEVVEEIELKNEDGKVMDRHEMWYLMDRRND